MACSDKGDYIAISGRAGFVVYLGNKKKWKLFGSELQEQSVVCHGGLLVGNSRINRYCVQGLLPSPAWAEGTVLSLCVCLSVCLSVCYHKIAVNFNYLKSKQATSHKLGNLRQKVVLYKTGKFLQASVARVAFKFGNKKN